MLRRAVLRRGLLVALSALGFAGAADARAHGPCGCLSPVVARPGTVVTTGPAYRIVLNPPAPYFRGGAGPPELASGYEPEAPSPVVMERERPPWPRRARDGRFPVPRDMPPGLYLVLVFDGSEGGQHATWDYLHVPDPPLDPSHGELHEIVAALTEVFPPM